METIDREFQVFAKPTGAKCNLGCRYCYYLKTDQLYLEKEFLMTDEILELYVRQIIEATTDNVINFSWHGGEPMLAGIEFYETVVRLQKKYKPDGRIIVNGIQTNGTLINDSWCKFLAENNFIVGVSIDGMEELHNRNRVTKSGSPTWISVISGIELMHRYGIIPELLCVVSSANSKYPSEVYDFLKSLGASYITFLPLVEMLDGTRSVSERTVDADEFGSFLSIIFDEWCEKDIGKIKVQIFEEALRSAFNQPHTLCIFKENCGGVPVVEHNGDFYSCDHYVNRAHLVGNIREQSLSDLLDSEKQTRFGLKKSETLPAYCLACDVLRMCNGECPKNRFICTPDGEKGLNYLCEGYRKFFRHCRPFIEAVSNLYRAQL